MVEKRLQQLRRILEVHVQLDYCVAARVLVAGENRALVAEIARQAKRSHSRVRPGDFGETVECAVCAVVVGEHELEAIAVAEICEHRIYAREKRAEIFDHIEHRHHEGDEWTSHLKNSRDNSTQGICLTTSDRDMPGNEQRSQPDDAA